MSRKTIVFTVAVFSALFLLFVIATIARTTDPEVGSPLGSDTFRVGSTKNLDASIDDGGPLLFQDLIHQGRGTNIYVNHLGNKLRSGWYVFDARAPEAAPRCILKWERKAKQFRDPCDDKTYPPDGTGLTQYKVIVAGGNVAVDFESEPVSSTTASTTSLVQ